MAADANFLQGEIKKFNECSLRLLSIIPREEEKNKDVINSMLDQLNSLESSLKITKNEEANVLLCHCCTIVSQNHELLVVKFCQVIVNLVAKQQTLLTQIALDTVTGYLLSALNHCQPWTISDILSALGSVLYENGGRVTKFCEDLLGKHGVLLQLLEQEEDVQKLALQCIENICMKCSSESYLNEEYVAICFDQFLKTLHAPVPTKSDPLVHSRIVLAAIRGIHYILSATKTAHGKHLGELLAALKTCMFCGLPGQVSISVPCLYATPMSQYPSNPGEGATLPTEVKPKALDKSGSKTSSAKKSKKKRINTKQKQKETEQDDVEQKFGETSLSSSRTSDVAADIFPLRPAWKVSSSESEYSDTEGGQASRLRSVQSKLRHCALGCLHAVIKSTDKKTLYGYWYHFIPDTPNTANSPQNQTLFIVILKDPAPKVRTAALAVLAALVDGSKQFLAAADDSEQHRAAFTPFSTVLGTMIKELHRCLLLALVAENSPLTITQLIKCIGILVPNVPYQKMKPGLLSRITKQIRSFLNHRDPNIRVACLTCLGAIVSVQAPLLEVCHQLQPNRLHTSQSISASGDTDSKLDSSYQSSQASITAEAGSSTPGNNTPNLPSGSRTPVLLETASVPQTTETCWLVRLCVRNITGDLKPERSLSSSVGGRSMQYEPLPVRLESLQVLANLTKSYFPFVRPSLLLLGNVIHDCLYDKDSSVQLHGAKLLEVLGSTVLQKNQDSNTNPQQIVTDDMLQEFWLKLLNGPLPACLQNDNHSALRATACDCMSTIGAPVFFSLSTDKRIMCITLLLGLTNDEDSHVRAAAIRALGVYILYPCLREDVSFVADAANAILMTSEDSNLSVRMKAAWSLANLSDAIVTNKEDGDIAFVEDFSDMLLLKMLTVAIKASSDNDKVKSNAVRSIGNMLRYVHQRCLGKSNIQNVVEQAIQALVKTVRTGVVKVQWNACYALGNLFKNKLLPLGHSSWTVTVYSSLCGVVKDCKNFKVRINAAMALSVPDPRERYGSSEQYTAIWSSLIIAIDNAEKVTDFAEFKYRETLTEQICGTLLHMIQHLCVDDLTPLAEILKTKEESLSALVAKYKAQNQDKAKSVEQAAAITNILDKEKLNSQHMCCLKSLKAIFTFTDAEEDTVTPKTAFVQTYD